MRTILIYSVLFAISAHLAAQGDFRLLDQKTFEFFNTGDYRNLKSTADLMLKEGMDYYYLRTRLGITEFNKGLYSRAEKNLTRALEFSSLDTISREYIYYSYLLSGRDADASLYLLSVPSGERNTALRAIHNPGLYRIFAGTGISGYDVFLYEKNKLYYEAVKNNLSINAGFDTYFLKRFKATMAYTNFSKKGTIYSIADSTGKDLNFVQNQVYAKLSGYLFPGWEFSGYCHVAFFSEYISSLRPRFGSSTLTPRVEYTAGAGIAKSGWKVRAGTNFSISNFANSNQLRGEGYLTILPLSNLNLYFTSGGMLQTDQNWGDTWQINQELGFKIFRFLWLESGIVIGNSFLYSRNSGYLLNNSFQIPETTIYSNLIIPGKKFAVTLSPYFSRNKIYSWNLNALTRTDELNPDSFGITLRLTYNKR